jgi:hypothetical protein
MGMSIRKSMITFEVEGPDGIWVLSISASSKTSFLAAQERAVLQIPSPYFFHRWILFTNQKEIH